MNTIIILYQEFFKFHSKIQLHQDATLAEDTETNSEGPFSPRSNSNGSPCRKRKLTDMDIYSFFQKSGTSNSDSKDVTRKKEGSQNQNKRKVVSFLYIL